jgi:hypothetical protein
MAAGDPPDDRAQVGGGSPLELVGPQSVGDRDPFDRLVGQSQEGQELIAAAEVEPTG